MKTMIFSSRLLLILGLMFSLIVSCDKDDDDEIAKDDIVGKWTISSSNTDVKVGSVSLLDYVVNTLQVPQEQAQVYVQMYSMQMTGSIDVKSDGTYTSTIDGDDSGVWELNSAGTVLTVDKGTKDEMEMKVISLTSSKLVVSMDETEMEDLNDDGVDEELTMEIEMTLTKS